MPSTFKSSYGANGQAITVTVASLATATARQSAVVDNTTNLYLDTLVSLKIKSPAASTASTGTVNVYAFATVDGGVTYTEGAIATDAAIVLTSPPNARLIGVLNVVANATTYYGGPLSVAKAFDGTLPDHWGLVIENKTGGTLDATAANHLIQYQGIYAQGT